jgi:hypothetical protein
VSIQHLSKEILVQRFAEMDEDLAQIIFGTTKMAINVTMETRETGMDAAKHALLKLDGSAPEATLPIPMYATKYVEMGENLLAQWDIAMMVTP